jgi:hypothetical protein
MPLFGILIVVIDGWFLNKPIRFWRQDGTRCWKWRTPCSPDEGVGPHYEGSVDRRHRPTDTHEYRNSHPFWKGDAKIATVWKRKSNALKDKHAFVSLSTFSCILRDWDFVAFEGEGIDSFHKDSIMAGTFG